MVCVVQIYNTNNFNITQPYNFYFQIGVEIVMCGFAEGLYQQLWKGM